MISWSIATLHSNGPSHENTGIEAFSEEFEPCMDIYHIAAMLQKGYPTILVKSVIGECMESQKRIIMDIQL